MNEVSSIQPTHSPQIPPIAPAPAPQAQTSASVQPQSQPSSPITFPEGEVVIPMQGASSSTSPVRPKRDKITFEILKHLGVLRTNPRGWSKEVNVVAWNQRPARVDIREWNSNHMKMSRGVGLDAEELERLKEILAEYEHPLGEATLTH